MASLADRIGTSLEGGLDELDRQLLKSRCESLNADEEIHEGDYVRFADGVERRVSFVTPSEWLPDIDSVQTSEGGSWYLGDGYCSFSGSLHLGVRRETLTLTEETKLGRVWFFHHDHARASNGVEVAIPFRVYVCSEAASL